MQAFIFFVAMVNYVINRSHCSMMASLVSFLPFYNLEEERELTDKIKRELYGMDKLSL